MHRIGRSSGGAGLGACSAMASGVDLGRQGVSELGYAFAAAVQ